MSGSTKRPSKIKVGYASVKIVEDNARLVESEAGAMFSPNLATIYVESQQKNDYAKMALLHEILHVCLHSSSVETDKTIEEHYVSAMAPVLLQTLRENPELIEFLTQQP
jgi:Zn-dependent peptidase ImmA (M78 family)